MPGTRNAGLLLLPVLLMLACNSKKNEEQQTVIEPPTAGKTIDTAHVEADVHYFWVAVLDQKNGITLERATPISADSLTVPLLLAKLNETYPEIKLEFSRQSHDSIFVKINKSNYLARQMGSSGAEAYLAEVTYNLTELKGINVVDFAFKAGDHATPGSYSRTDFINPKD